MKKKPPKNRKIGSATGSHFLMQKRTVKKGPERKKALPPWRDVRNEIK